MKIVFCTLHVRRSAQAVPLAAGYLAAALPADVRRGATLVDVFPDQSDREIIELILTHKPQLVMFPVYVWNRQRIVQIARRLHDQQPALQLIGGGPEATGDLDRLISEAPWTALVLGEGEGALRGLVEQLAKGPGQQPLPGVVFNVTGKSLSGQDYCEFDLNTAESPWLSGIIGPTAEGGVLWEVARGCAFSCDYCFDARGHAGVRPIPSARLEAELEHFVKQGVSQVWILDSTFNYPPERGIALLQMLLDKAPGLHYHFEAKADFIDRHTVSLLGRLSCSVQIGLQSVREEVLKTIHRPLDLEILTEKVHLLEAEGIIYGFDLIYGLPGDNYAGFRESIDTVMSFAPNHVHIFPLAILPGTRLFQQQARYGIIAQDQPPYELISSDDWSAEEMALGRRLAAAVDLFYNTGRAVAFFPAILEALQVQPSALFEDFFKWLLQQPEIEHDELLRVDSWSASDVYRMLQGYICHQLKITGQGHLVSVFLDLLCYHFNYAETLLSEELLPPADKRMQYADIWETPWQRSRKCRLVPFAYEILDLLEMEEMQLAEVVQLFRPVGSVALFLRRDNEVICESLSEEMLLLLKQSNGQNSPKDIFAGSLPQATGEELVQFAISEGLLHPAENLAT
ncbi:MAG: DUF4080 domain-containing protein [Desulfuromonadales bacterium]|nr:DUF4080 domain-containing protein [Desulfuromonadales bacterium]